MRSTAVTALFFLLFGLVACQDNPVSPTPPVALMELTEVSDFIPLPLYKDSISPVWTTVGSSDVILNGDAIDFVYAGNSALAITPQSSNNTTLIANSSSAEIAYPMSRILGIEFWVNGGYQSLPTTDLIIGFLGSEGARLELPISQLLVQTDLPANKWERIEIVFSRMAVTLPDPYLAGIYFRNENSQPFFLDDIILLALRDNIAPTVRNVTSRGENALVIQFSEEMDPFSVQRRSAYLINDTTPIQVSYNHETKEVTLILEQVFNPNETYTLTIGDVRDAGFPTNSLRGENSFTVTPFEVAAPTPIPPAPTRRPADDFITVYLQQEVQPISPYIYGVASADQAYLEELQPTLNRWGGNPSTRYNWQLGNAWNAARDWEYRNTSYGQSGNIADQFLQTNQTYDVSSLLTIPTLGWVAKDTHSCSFPLPDGSCGTAQSASCDNPASQRPDPYASSIEAPPEFMVAWVEHLKNDLGVSLPFLAMDNEPNLWGITHYDVHPDCTGYDEIFERFMMYAEPIKELSPESEIIGPSSCCWWYYWNSMIGDQDWVSHGGVEFIPWFLQQAQEHEQKTGQRILDVLDIHYYPENVYGAGNDSETAGRRLRSTKSLYDPLYNDESWINEPMQLIPRMNWTIDAFYPGTKLSISEWNWGAEDTMNGALAIADVLGIYGREGLYMAAYWTHPPFQSPGYYAFKMYTNYDGQGSKFLGNSVKTVNTSDLTSYVAHDEETNLVKVMLINKDPEQWQRVQLFVEEYGMLPMAYDFYQYSDRSTAGISHTHVDTPDGVVIVDIPPYSINLLVVQD